MTTRRLIEQPIPADGRLTRAIRNADLDRHNARVLHQVITETTTQTVRGATAGGDERKLRGIPAIGRGVTGAIAGSSPHHQR